MNDKEIRSLVSIHRRIPLFDSDGASFDGVMRFSSVKTSTLK